MGSLESYPCQDYPNFNNSNLKDDLTQPGQISFTVLFAYNVFLFFFCIYNILKLRRVPIVGHTKYKMLVNAACFVYLISNLGLNGDGLYSLISPGGYLSLRMYIIVGYGTFGLLGIVCANAASYWIKSILRISKNFSKERLQTMDQINSIYLIAMSFVIFVSLLSVDTVFAVTEDICGAIMNSNHFLNFLTYVLLVSLIINTIIVSLACYYLALNIESEFNSYYQGKRMKWLAILVASGLIFRAVRDIMELSNFGAFTDIEEQANSPGSSQQIEIEWAVIYFFYELLCAYVPVHFMLVFFKHTEVNYKESHTVLSKATDSNKGDSLLEEENLSL